MKKIFNPDYSTQEIICPNCGETTTLCIRKNTFWTCKCGVEYFTKAFAWSKITKKQAKKISSMK